jgi:hypothetical protein
MPHTPEPWYIDADGFICGSDDTKTADPHCDTQDIDEREANASRIVAAINACTRISTEALEQGVVGQLVNALEDLYNWLTPDWQQSNLGDKARAAIAKATGRAV